MTSAIDTNILLDLLDEDAVHAAAAEALLTEYARAGRLVVWEVVLGELAGRFLSSGHVATFLHEVRIRLAPSSPDALFAAGEAWQRHRRARPSGLTCPSCGTRQRVSCPSCSRDLSPRQHLVADFLIGGHSLVHADRLLLRDRGYYRTYFPDLVLS